MTLPSTYADRNCSLARALEVVGERWTLLIVRDAFFGVRRFGDFASQLKIPRAVLANRLKSLVQEGVLIRDDDAAGGIEYRLSAKGVALWPIVRALMNWGDAFYSPSGVKRTVRHDQDGGLLDHEGHCQDCGLAVPVPEIRIEPGPGFDLTGSGNDPCPVRSDRRDDSSNRSWRRAHSVGINPDAFRTRTRDWQGLIRIDPAALAGQSWSHRAAVVLTRPRSTSPS